MAKDRRAKLLEELIRNPASAAGKAAELEGAGVGDPGAFRTAKEILDDPDGPDRAAQFAGLPYPVKVVLLDELAAEGAANFLARLQRDEKDKGVAKAIAKAIHACRAQGLKVSDLREKRSVAFDFGAESPPDSWASPIDAEGNRLVLLARVTAMGRLNVFHAVCGDVQGLQNFEGMGMTRASYRRFLRMAEAQMGVALAKVPGDWAAWRIAEAARLATANGLPTPAAYEPAKALIEPPATAPADPLPSTLDRAAVERDSASLVSRSAELHTFPECAFWVPDEPTLEKLSEKVKEADASKVATSDEQRKDLRLRYARDVAREYWTGANRKLWAGRLSDTAYVLAATGRPDDGRLAWATALELGKDTAWEAIPFAVELFEKIVKHGGLGDHPGHTHAEHAKLTAGMREAARSDEA